MRFSLVKTLLTACVFAAGHTAIATPWNNGGADSTVTVGPTGDYTSLYDCATSFTTTAGGINANWKIEIQAAGSPYLETNSSLFANTIASGKTVTLKPASGATVVVNMTQSGSQTINGGIIIGSTTTSTADAVIPTNGFIIDGSNNGSSSRDLTLNTSSTVAMHVINIWGSSTNGVIKNCIITNGYVGNSQADCIRLNGRQVASGPYTGPNEPNNWTITNNIITGIGNTNEDGIGCLTNGTLTSGNAIQGLVVSGNTITARRFPLHLNHNTTTTIDSNTIRIPQSTLAGISRGIYHDSNGAGVNGVGGWSWTVTNNKIDQLEYTGLPVADVGLRAMDLSNSPSGAAQGVYNVYNNTISGFNYSYSGAGTKTGGMIYGGIYSQGNGGTINVYHNSINMTNFSDIGTSTAGTQVNRVGGIILTTAGPQLNAKNNIIRMFQDNGLCIMRGSSALVSFNGNDLFVNSAGTNQRIGRVNGTEYPTFANWQVPGYDANGHNVDPADSIATGGAAWASASATDLHLVPTSNIPANLVGIAGLPVATDIDGQTRSVSAPIAGADEVLGSASVQDWQLL